MTDKLLDLSALERDTITLADGTELELRNPSELGPLEEFKYRGLVTQVQSYDPTNVSTEEEAHEYERALQSLAALLAVDFPEGVDASACAAIFGVWVTKHATPADPPRPTRPPRDRQPKKKSTGAK